MQQTTNIGLELYEPTDNANLEDGYNSSMRKLDQRDGEVSTLIAALSTTVTGYDTRITAAETAAAAASTAAATADAKADTAEAHAQDARNGAANAYSTAETALGFAQEGLRRLGGMHIEFIRNDDAGTKFSIGDWADDNCVFNAFIIYDDEGHGLLVGEFTASSSSTTATTAWQSHNIVRLRDWGRDQDEGAEDYGYAKVINNDWYNAGTVSRITSTGYIYWTVFHGASSALPAQESVTGTIITQVAPR